MMKNGWCGSCPQKDDALVSAAAINAAIAVMLGRPVPPPFSIKDSIWVRVEHAMGVLMVITGIGFLTGAVSSVSIWLLETFPALQNFG